MKIACPVCSAPFEVESPGLFLCPSCQASFEVRPDGFEWAPGEHLDDTREAAPVTLEEIPQGIAMDEGEKPAPVGMPVCDVCRVNLAVRACPSCGRLICDACALPAPAGLPICRDCAAPGGADDDSFENYSAGRFFARYFNTIPRVAFHSSEFFGNLPIPGKLWPAVIFGVLSSIPGAIVSVVANLALQNVLLKSLAEIPSISPEVSKLFTTPMSAAFMIGALILSPIIVFIQILVNGLITHVLLLMLGGPAGGFEETIRVTGYSKVADLVQIVPGLGPIVSMVWKIVICSVGLSKVHRIPVWKPVLALLAPFLLFCCCIGIGLALIFGGIFASGITA
jgi:hypothetical protein